ncbi:hypothetical protein RclHR1_10210001 [Rhizophagus clarus]|uniref:F-box domain-containing protein n=1 Tax=Rhizophagus clarus TaxID=94130 RepID=A0A2Z6QT31_9GLOM|nr:hypothetical protein RclHR1_10210001 [Rhizophagus clarus]
MVSIIDSIIMGNPFSIPTKNYNFIEIYLCNLNDDLKSKLNEYVSINNLFSSNILFNYPSFLKHLSTQLIDSSVMEWSMNFYSENGYFIDLNSIVNFDRLVHSSLIKIFIENEVNLYTLDIDLFFYHGEIYYDNFELILQHPNFIHNIRNLNLYITCNSFARFSYNNNDDNNDMIIKNFTSISQIINLHQNLKKILLSYDNFPLYQRLLLSKDYNCLNTLNTIILFRIDFKGLNNLDKVFEQLNVLESIHIIYCYPLNIGFTQQIINLTKPFKLKTLILDDGAQIDESLILLLQKYGDYLENFWYEFKFDRSISRQQFFESITKYCKNIKFFQISEVESQNIYSILNLIGNITQNLNYLSINKSIFLLTQSNDNCCSIILQNLGQILPIKLEHLYLSFSIEIDDFETFLKNSQKTFIKKLLINTTNSRNILPFIKEYIMKRKRVKYLAIADYSRNYKGSYDNELFSMKDEVKEFELYNIKIKKCDDLYIGNELDFIKELD